MPERKQITHMQVRMVRMAIERRNLSVGEAARVFRKKMYLSIFVIIMASFMLKGMKLYGMT